jgi:hypothetical protein
MNTLENLDFTVTTKQIKNSQRITGCKEVEGTKIYTDDPRTTPVEKNEYQHWFQAALQNMHCPPPEFPQVWWGSRICKKAALGP